MTVIILSHLGENPMLLNRDIKSSYSKEEVQAAKEHLSEIKLFSKPLIALNKENQNVFLTLFIGEDNKFGFYEIAKDIESKIHEYLNIPDSGEKIKTTQAKNKISNEIVEINKKLVDTLRKPEVNELYGDYTSIFLATSAFYPAPEFMFLSNKGERVSISNKDDLKHSAALKQTPFKGFGYIAVSPPTSSSVYSYLNDTFKNANFLVHCLRANSASAWSKYTNGRSIPIAVSWGLFLLAIGIHPLYKLEHRNQKEGFFNTELFKDLFPVWGSAFNHTLWKHFGKEDLKPYQSPKVQKHRKLDYPALRSELEATVRKWYGEGNQLPNFSTAQKLIDTLNHKYETLKRNLSLWKDINEIILMLSQHKVFSQTKTRLYIAAYSIEHEFPDDLDQKIFELSSVASFLHFDANPSSNIYIMLRYLADDISGDIRKMTFLTGISSETWVRYEQATRIPHSAAWTAMLLCLDLHPIYRIKKRSDPAELKLAYDVYKELHHTITPKTEEFHLHELMDFNDFLQIAK